eukprot:7349336-Prorocentrum_lima.AAC.1
MNACCNCSKVCENVPRSVSAPGLQTSPRLCPPNSTHAKPIHPSRRPSPTARVRWLRAILSGYSAGERQTK